MFARYAAAASDALFENSHHWRRARPSLGSATRSSKSTIGWMLPTPAWKTLTMRTPYFSPISVMRRRCAAVSSAAPRRLGLHVARLKRPIAPKACLRHFQSLRRSFGSSAGELREPRPLGKARPRDRAARRVRPPVRRAQSAKWLEHRAGTQLKGLLQRDQNSLIHSSPAPPARFLGR